MLYLTRFKTAQEYSGYKNIFKDIYFFVLIFVFSQFLIYWGVGGADTWLDRPRLS
jgi:hypothetical protein